MIICHSRFVLSLARQYGWKAGARYTNLRDVRHLNEVFFIDIDWKNYDFERHLWAVQSKKPRLTVARDVTDARELDEILHEAEKLSRSCERVIVVPKDAELLNEKRLGIPTQFRLGYSVPTKYGKTTIPPERFTGDVHLLGGRPDVQRKLASRMNVVSLDGNRITLDAKFGDVFVGDRFTPLRNGNYERCLRMSFENVNRLWVHSKERIDG